MTLTSEIIARRMRLTQPLTHDVTRERDLRVTMDDGAVLLADRWVARDGARPAPADGAGALALRAHAVRRAAVRAAAGRARAAGRDPERARHVRLRGRVQPVRRARRRAGHAALDPRAAVACRADRDDRARATSGLVQWAVAPDAGDDLAALAIQVSASQFHGQTYAGGSLSLETVGLVAGARRRAGAPAGAAGDGPRAAPPAGRCSPSCRSARLDERATGAEVGVVSRGAGQPAHARTPTGSTRDFAAGVAKVTGAGAARSAAGTTSSCPWMLEDFAALQAAGREPQLVIGPWTHTAPGSLAAGVARGARAGCAPTCSTTTGWCARRRSACSSPASAPAAAGASCRAGRRRAPASGGCGSADDGACRTERPRTLPERDRYRYDPADPTPSLGGPVLLARERRSSTTARSRRGRTCSRTRRRRCRDARGDRAGPRRAVRAGQLAVLRRVRARVRRRRRRRVVERLRRAGPRRARAASSRSDDGRRGAVALRAVADRPPLRGRPPHPPPGLLRRAPALRAQPRHRRGPVTATRLQPVDVEVLHGAEHPSALLSSVMPPGE